MPLHDFMPILGPIISALLLAAIFYWLKLPQTIKENTDAVKRLTLAMDEMLSEIERVHERLDEHQRRHEVTQQILSDITDEAIDTRQIIANFEHYPKLKNYKQKRDS